MLGNILNKLQPQWITGYHEHNSLLEHIFDEELPEEERKAAWETYKAQMAAESMSYNYSALQTRLNEESAAQAQQAQAQQGPSGILSVDGIVNTLTAAVQQTKLLQALFVRDQILRSKLTQASNPMVAAELKSNSSALSQHHNSVFATIRQVNEILSQWQMGQVTLHPDAQKVESLRVELLSELGNFKSMTSQPTVNTQGMPNLQAAAGIVRSAASSQGPQAQQMSSVIARALLNQQQLRAGQSPASWQSSSRPQVPLGQTIHNFKLGRPQ